MADEGKTGTRKLKISEICSPGLQIRLPIYEAPEVKIEYVKEDPSQLQQQISKVRKVVWKWMESVQSTTNNIQDKYEIGKAHTQSTIDYLQSDPATLPRIGVITAAGLGGALLGFRGGVIKKVFYGSAAAITAASLCYPNEAVDISKQSYEEICTFAKDQWKGISSSDKGKKS